MESKSAQLTIVILTKNEAFHLPRCLEGLPERYPVVVLDSGSTDGTDAIAEQHGCAVFRHPWSGFAAQRNFALERCGIGSKWVLFIDADEIFPLRFFAWFEAEVAAAPDIDAVLVPSTLYLRGKALRFAPGYPILHPRLVQTERVRFLTNHTGHGESIPEDLRTRIAPISYQHHFYNGELIGWMHKHVDKARLEVALKPTAGAMVTRRGRLSLFIGRSVWRIPARFLYHYLLRGGILDGFAGLEFALMFTWYEATIYVQARISAGASNSQTQETHRWQEVPR